MTLTPLALTEETRAHLARLAFVDVWPPSDYVLELDRQLHRLQQLADATKVDPATLIVAAQTLQAAPTFGGSYADAVRIIADRVAAGGVA